NPADDSYTLYTSTQNPHGARTVLAQAVFHLPETKFRVIAQDVGGGFGMKGDTYPEEGLVLWASRRGGRPGEWIPTRSECLGRAEAVYLTERLLDRAAAVIGIDPVEIRRRNFIAASAMPYQTPTGFVYDSGEFAATTDRCLEIADWKGFAARRAASEKRGKRR